MAEIHFCIDHLYYVGSRIGEANNAYRCSVCQAEYRYEGAARGYKRWWGQS